MDPTLGQLILQLIQAVGVGNFVLVAITMFIIANAPNIITQIISSRAQAGQKKNMSETIGTIRSLLVDLKEHSVKITDLITANKSVSESVVQSVSEFQKRVVRESDERREENVLITENLIKMLGAIDSIEKMMRNVMTEKDAMALISSKMGIKENFKHKLLDKVMKTIESLSGLKDGQMSYDLKSDLNSTWSDFKSEFESFNTPIDIHGLLSKYDEELWKETGLFQQIVNLAISELEIDRKKEAISKQIDSGIRVVQSSIGNYLEQRKKDRS